MKDFLAKHESIITGVVSVSDRVILKGYLPISYIESAEVFFSRHGMLLKEFKDFTKTQTEALKEHAIRIANHANRPYEYLREHVRKEEYVRRIAARDEITEGLICVLATNEENHTFSLRYGDGRPHLTRCSPRCLTLYFYYIDRYFGFMHVRLSTWMPFTIQVYVNGHDWLARQLDAKNVEYTQKENAFTEIGDYGKTQKIADRFERIRWERILHVFARQVNPLLRTVLKGMEYYWVIDQAEYATDIIFNNHAALKELYLNMQRHAVVCTQAEDIMKFMGRRLHGSFRGVIETDAKKVYEVTRIKHKVRGNWIKMYNKHGIVLRVETVINRPQEFRTFRLGHGKKPGCWAPLPKRISSMHRYAQIALSANSGYIDALASVDNPVEVYGQLQSLCAPKTMDNRRVRGLNPLGEKDRTLFEAVLRGEHFIHGFNSSDLARNIGVEIPTGLREKKRHCSRMNRTLRLLRGHSLIARIPHSRRYRITKRGACLMNAFVDLRSSTLPILIKENH